MVFKNDKGSNNNDFPFNSRVGFHLENSCVDFGTFMSETKDVDSNIVETERFSLCGQK